MVTTSVFPEVRDSGDAPPVVPGTEIAGSGALHRLKRWGWFLIGLQLVALLVFSTIQYTRYALATDFGAYSQAWWKIAHGQLDPSSSLFGTSFWKNDAEFAMWPLSLLSHVYPHPILLLWVQDLVVVATELVAFGWILDVLAPSVPQVNVRRSIMIGSGAAVVIALNPWIYETIGFDFHFETFAAFFVVLVGRDLWGGRTRRLWWWVALALVCGVLGGLYLIGVGLCGVAAAKRTRRTGVLIGLIGLASFVLLTSIGAAGLGERLIDSGYGYLVGPHTGHIGVQDIVIGMVHHPGSVAHMIALRWPTVFEFLIVVGLVGVVSPWGAGVALVVFVPSILNSNPAFFRLTQSFQIWPALPFVLVGSVMVIIRLGASGRLARRGAVAAMAVWAVSFGVVTAAALPDVPGQWIAVDAQAAAQLARSAQQIPARAEVIASQGIVGRFAERDYVYNYPYIYGPVHAVTTYPVNSSRVVFVLTSSQGVSEASGARIDTAVRFIEHRLRARVIAAQGGVYVLEWSPPPHTTTVRLP